MLKQRILTALLLLAVLLPATFYPSAIPFGLVTLILLACAAWEWARLNAYAPPIAVATGGVCALLCGFAWFEGIPSAHMGFMWIGIGRWKSGRG